MQAEPIMIRIRPADLTGVDDGVVSRLIEAYLIRTEFEKATHRGGSGGDRLPERYLHEVESPAEAYEDAVVHLAELDRIPVGVVVVQQHTATREIKRLWVDPSARGHRIGSALIDAAIVHRELPVRLTVWEWREDAVRLYRQRGFVPVASWEDRPGLVCMELPAKPSARIL